MKTINQDINKLVSIVITSYNYGHFLKQAIGSALNQTYPNIEVIVVDDGSKDNSREVIDGYGNKIISIFKENGGQASAFNAGFKLSKGEAICFMDSDDLLLPTAIEKAMELLVIADVVKVHWPLIFINEHGKPTGEVMHKQDIAEGDLRDAVIANGPAGYNWASTSGNVWKRQFLEAVFPMPEPEYKIGPDVYLAALSPFFGIIKKTQEPQGCYRIHTENNTFRKAIEKRVEEALVHWDHSFKILNDYCRGKGIDTDIESWKGKSWWHQMALSLQEIAAVVPEKDTFIFIDENQWVAGKTFLNRHCIPFIEKEGENWGPPFDDKSAIEELEKHRKAGITFLIFAAPAFWWLDEYLILNSYLRENFECVLENNRLVIFDLRSSIILNKTKAYEYC
jgi:glycosyltransferase involved in cell wall biosynthesis